MSDSLPTAVLGQTNLEVTRLGYGAGHRKPMDSSQQEKVLNSILDGGINFVDTADCYGQTYDDIDTSEKLIGKYISHRRSEFHIATKCGGSDSGHNWSKENVFRNLHDSLVRMKTDYVDIMQLHGAKSDECEKERLVESLVEMREKGKVRWIGASTNLPDLATYAKWNVFDVFQLPYSALERDHEKWITQVARNGAGVIIRGGIALGEPGTGMGNLKTWERFEKAGLDELRSQNESRTSLILRFTLTHPDVHTNIVGTTNPAHIAENIKATMAGPLPENVYREAKRRLDNVGTEPHEPIDITE